MRRYKLLPGGSHTDENGRVFRPGQIVQSELQLDKIFANRFVEEKISPSPRKPVAPPVPQDPEDDDDFDDEETPSFPSGKEVTESFPAASGYGYRVFKDGRLHFVVSEDAPSVLLNEGVELKSAKAVINFINQLVSVE